VKLNVKDGLAGLPEMNPEERALWLAAKGAPPNMMLVTREEHDRVMRALKAEHETRVGHEAGINMLILLVGDYWKAEPDLPNAVSAAMFDATRYKKAVEHALPRLKATIEKLNAAAIAANNEDVDPTVKIDVALAIAELEQIEAVLKKYSELRRERLKKSEGQ
jgi:hypothetical protein